MFKFVHYDGSWFLDYYRDKYPDSKEEFNLARAMRQPNGTYKVYYYFNELVEPTIYVVANHKEAKNKLTELFIQMHESNGYDGIEFVSGDGYFDYETYHLTVWGVPHKMYKLYKRHDMEVAWFRYPTGESPAGYRMIETTSLDVAKAECIAMYKENIGREEGDK